MDAFADLLRRLSLDVTSLANELRRLLAIRARLEELVSWWMAGFGVEPMDAAYTLVLADNWKLKQSTGAGATTVTVPPVTAVPFQAGRTQINFARMGTGTLTLAAGAGVTLLHSSSLSARAQNSVITATMIEANVWLVTGDMT